MSNHLKFYINGAWLDPVKPATLDVINPATEEAYTKISVGSAADVDRAVAAARAAFPAFSQTSREERLRLLRRILEIYKERIDDIARAVSEEMGAPMRLARNSQAAGPCTSSDQSSSHTCNGTACAPARPRAARESFCSERKCRCETSVTAKCAR